MEDDLDPFGRRKDDNPLASLGWDGDETASTVDPQPGPRPEPARPAGRARPAEPAESWKRPTRRASGPSPLPPRRHRPPSPGSSAPCCGPSSRAAPAWVSGGSSAPWSSSWSSSPSSAGSSAHSSTKGSIARTASCASSPRPTSRRRRCPAPTSATGRYGRLANLRVAPDRIDATMVTQGGRLRLVQIVPGGTVRVLQTTPGGFTGAPTMSLKGIDPGAPNRLTRSAAQRLGSPASRIDYLVLTEFGGERQWNAYFKGGQIFSADVRGRIIRRVS